MTRTLLRPSRSSTERSFPRREYRKCRRTSIGRQVLPLCSPVVAMALLLACTTTPGDEEAVTTAERETSNDPATDGDRERVTGDIDKYLKKAKHVSRSIPIFSQVVTFRHSPEWQLVHEQALEESYIMELIPRDQKLRSWRDMIIVQGFKGVAGKPSMTPLAALKSIAYGIRKNCDAEFVYQSLGDRKIDSYDAHVAIIGCGDSSDSIAGVDPRPGEVAWFLAILGTHDIYLIHQAVRGDRFSKDSAPIDRPEAERMLAAMQPIKLCEGSESRGECSLRDAR